MLLNIIKKSGLPQLHFRHSLYQQESHAVWSSSTNERLLEAFDGLTEVGHQNSMVLILEIHHRMISPKDQFSRDGCMQILAKVKSFTVVDMISVVQVLYLLNGVSCILQKDMPCFEVQEFLKLTAAVASYASFFYLAFLAKYIDGGCPTKTLAQNHVFE